MTTGASEAIVAAVLAFVEPGDEVLVWGAAGGLGHAAVQIAKLLGAGVIAVVGNPGKAGFVKTVKTYDVNGFVTVKEEPVTGAAKPLCVVNPKSGGGRTGQVLGELRATIERALGAADDAERLPATGEQRVGRLELHLRRVPLLLGALRLDELGGDVRREAAESVPARPARRPPRQHRRRPPNLSTPWPR